MQKQLKQRIVCLLGAAVATMVLAGPLRAQDEPEVIQLTAIDSYAPTALWVRVFLDYFLPEVDRRLAEKGNYEIKWNKAFGGTIAKTRGVLEALQYDLADIGIITTPYHPDKVPYYNIPYVTPYVTSDIGLVGRTVHGLVEKYPALRREWDDYRIVYLTAAGSIDTYQLLLTEEPESTEALQGWKIGGVGLNLRYLEGMRATPVNSGLSDWYNNMSTGLLDGVIGWAEATIAYKLFEVAPYMLDVQLGAVTSKVIGMNQRTWDRLPDEVRNVILEAAIDYRDELALETDRRARHSLEAFAAEGGKMIPMTIEQRREWALALPNIAQEWADVLESRGLPGRQILKDYMDIMRENDQPIVRHWDRE